MEPRLCPDILRVRRVENIVVRVPYDVLISTLSTGPSRLSIRDRQADSPSSCTFKSRLRCTTNPIQLSGIATQAEVSAIGSRKPPLSILPMLSRWKEWMRRCSNWFGQSYYVAAALWQSSWLLVLSRMLSEGFIDSYFTLSSLSPQQWFFRQSSTGLHLTRAFRR